MKTFAAFFCAVLCMAFLTLPAFADGEAAALSGASPVTSFIWQFFLVMTLVFVALLLTKRIAAWVDKKREERKK